MSLNTCTQSSVIANWLILMITLMINHVSVVIHQDLADRPSEWSDGPSQHSAESVIDHQSGLIDY